MAGSRAKPLSARAVRRTARRAPTLRAIAGLVSEVPEDSLRLVSERIRLGILSALAVNESLTFTELRGILDTSDGNLSVHARKLEEAGYLLCRKGFEGRVPRTDYALTAQGRKALDRYLDHMEALIRATRG